MRHASDHPYAYGPAKVIAWGGARVLTHNLTKLYNHQIATMAA